jgi:hypothetical protein
VHAAGIKPQVCDSTLRECGIGIDVQPRHAYECPLVRARMRQGEGRVVEERVVNGDDVDIQCARTPADFPYAIAVGLHLLTQLKQFMGCQGRLDDDHGVEEVILLGATHG